MEITTLGVGIDPTKAVSGAATAVKAAESMASGMNAAAIKAEKGEKGVGAAGLDMGNKVQQGSDKAARSANALASLGAWGKLRASLAGMASGMVSAFSTIGKAVLVLGAAFGALQAAMLPIMAIVGTLKMGFSVLAGAINGAADFEDYNIQWAQLLGSFDKAKMKMSELSDIADKTPFNLPDIVQGSLSLQTYSEGLLASRDKILMIGDAAAKAKQPFATMAETMGRIFVNAKYGGEIMEQLKTAMAQTLISGPAFAQLSKLGGVEANAGGKNFKEIWTIMESEMAKAKNSMLLMSEATNGLFSTLADGWAKFQRTFGEALNSGVRPLVRALTEEIGTWTEKAKTLAPQIEAAAIEAAALVNVMRKDGGFSLAFKVAWQEAKDTASQVINTLGDILKNRIEIAVFAMVEQFKAMQTPAFWKGMGEQLKIAATEFVDTVTLGLTSAARSMKAEVSGFGSDLAKLGNGIIGLDGKMINEALFGVEPTLPTRGGITAGAQAGPNPLLPPVPLDWKDAWAKNGTGESPEMAELKAKLAKEVDAIKATNKKSTDDGLLYKGNAGAAAGLATGALDKGGDVAKAKEAASQLESAAKRVIDATRSPMETFNRTMSELQTLQASGMISATQYSIAAKQASDEYAQSVTQAAETAKRAAYDQMTPLQQLLAQWRDLGTAMKETSREIAGSISSNMGDALTDMITGAASAGDAFSRMAKSIVNDLARMASQMLINWAIQKAIGLVVGAIGGGGAVAGQAIGGAVTAAAVAHTGGTVGQTSNFRTVPTSSFRNAPRFQHGGKVGSGETAIIAEPGEQVLTRDGANDIKARLGASQAPAEAKPQAVTILNVVDRTLIEQHIAANPSIILNAIGANASKIRRALKV